MTGEAFAGEVTEAEPDRAGTGKRPVLRPWVTVATTDEVLIEPGAVLKSPARPGQQATVIDVVPPAPGNRRPQAATAGPGSSLSSRAAWAGR